MHNKIANHRQSCWLPNSQSWFGWLAFAVSMILAFTWPQFCPMALDDFMYRYMYQYCTPVGGYGDPDHYTLPYVKIPYAIYFHIIHNNGRWANLAYMVAIPFPVWLVKLFLGIALSGLYLLFMNWANRVNLKNNLIALIMPVLFWFGLPWSHHFESSDFHFNYILPTVMMLGAMMLLLRRRKPGLWTWLLLFVFAAWHEGFTIVFASFVLGLYIFHREKKFIWALVVLACGFLVQMTPGTVARIAEGLSDNLGKHYAGFSFIELWPSVLALVLWPLLRQKYNSAKRRLIDAFGFGFVLSWIAMIVIIALILPEQRAHWPNNVLAVCFILLLLRRYGKSHVSLWIKVAFSAIYLAWGTSLLYYQLRVRQVVEYATTQLEISKPVMEDGAGYAGLNIPFWVSRFCYVPYGSFCFLEQVCVSGLSTPHDFYAYVMLPPEKYGRDIREFAKIPGNNDYYYVYPSAIVRPATDHNYEELRYEIKFGEPTISTPLTDIVNSVFGKRPYTETLDVQAIVRIPYLNDSIDVLMFHGDLRGAEGREIIEMNLVERK